MLPAAFHLGILDKHMMKNEWYFQHELTYRNGIGD